MNNPLDYFLWLVSGIAFFSLLEYFFPAEKGQTIKGRLRNIGHLIVFHFLGLIGFTLIYVIYYPKAVWSYSPSNVELLISVPFNLLLIDFLFYWYHRAEHHFSWLWPIHELHHSEGEMNVTTSYRTYWLEMPLQNLFVIFPTILFFGALGPKHAFIMPFAVSLFLLFSHSNLRFNLGVLSLLVCGPQVHRIHHSKSIEHRDKNFAQFFPFIDKLFGTYYSPGEAEFPATGVDTMKTDTSVLRSLLRPFNLWFKRGTS